MARKRKRKKKFVGENPFGTKAASKLIKKRVIVNGKGVGAERRAAKRAKGHTIAAPPVDTSTKRDALTLRRVALARLQREEAVPTTQPTSPVCNPPPYRRTQA